MTQKDALDILKLGHNVYLTGGAGSGKTYLLNQYIDYLKKADVDVAVTASTGIAASHMNGVTIHSWTGMGIRSSLSPYDLEAMEEKRYLWDRFQKTKVLIIDEISMLHHYRLDLVDKIARFFKRNDLPFGGMQVILCGDFFQLPPVARAGEEDACFAYHSKAWQSLNLKVCYLEGSYRQHDPAFISVLNAIRTNYVTEEILKHLHARNNKEPEYAILPTKLFTHNVDVDDINARELAATEGSTFTYDMTDQGSPALAQTLKNNCLAPGVLSLKKGAQVMFVKNNYDKGYVNGTLGTVVDCLRDYPIVKTVQGKLIKAEPEEWGVEEDGKIKARIKQVPLRLAWAITVHKSQGMTLDAAEIDLSKSFEKGMGYVALSRLKSLQGLKLLGINEIALKVDEEVLLYDERLQEESVEHDSYIQKMNEELKLTYQKAFLTKIAPQEKTKKKKKVETHVQTKSCILEKLSLKEIAQKRKLKEETIIDHIEKIQSEGEHIDIRYLCDDAFSEKEFEKIEDAFRQSYKKCGDYRLAPVKDLLNSKFSYSELRLARLFIERE
ncbi:AAA family ATPase [Patescibacteria group bacterium]|nr:AAA family ATPase [Patescibacteria group bacterium]